ncbi:MAG: hypothetical protein V3R84_01150, partial [Acidimicrobiia bacterium]
MSGRIGTLSREEKVWGFLKWVSIALFLIVTVFPLIYMIGLSFKNIAELFRNPANFLPSWDQIFSFETYREVLRSRDQGGQGFWTFIRNSAVVSVTTVIVTTSLGVLAAYAVARLNFFGKRALSLGIIMVYLFPAVVISIPLFVMFSRVGTIDFEILGITLGLPGLDL